MFIVASNWSFTLFPQTFYYLMALGGGGGLIWDVILEEGSDFCDAMSQGGGGRGQFYAKIVWRHILTTAL